MPAPTAEQRQAAELDQAVEGALLCLQARDHVEALTDRELVSAVEKQIWGALCRFGSQEDWLLDELINRFETHRGLIDWIPAADRTPGHFDSVLGYVTAGGLVAAEPMRDVVSYDAERKVWLQSIGGEDAIVQVSHWMPLPKNP